MLITEGADILLCTCGSLRTGERVVIVNDPHTRAVGDLLAERARAITPSVDLVEAPVSAMHGVEPPPDVAAAMRQADLCIGLTTKSLAHTAARMAASQTGARYLSLPDYSLQVLASDALRVDYRARAPVAQRIADAFTAGRVVRVTTARGTDLTMRIDGRRGNCCPGYVERAGELGSPPDIESNVPPIEDAAEGILVVDGSIPCPQIGLLDAPVTLHVTNGRIVEIRGAKTVVASLQQLFDGAGVPNTRVLAECGVGLNDRAKLCGIMLMDEGVNGSVHFGFGSNVTIGGNNAVPFHLDFVVRAPTLSVDNRTILDKGVLQ